MFSIFKNKKVEQKELQLYSPVVGKMVDLESVPDKTFASKVMGDGVGFVLDEGVIYSPCDGTVTLIASTLHAIGIASNVLNVEILIHIGLDTVQLNGKGFKKLVNQGDKVKKGTPLLQIEKELFESKDVNLVTPMIITNHEDFNLEIQKDIGSVTRETIVIKCESK